MYGGITEKKNTPKKSDIWELIYYLNRWRGDVGHLKESKWFLGKMNEPLEGEMGDLTVCDKVYLRVELISSLSCD